MLVSRVWSYLKFETSTGVLECVLCWIKEWGATTFGGLPVCPCHLCTDSRGFSLSWVWAGGRVRC